jgi:hypothetical protein
MIGLAAFMCSSDELVISPVDLLTNFADAGDRLRCGGETIGAKA